MSFAFGEIYRGSEEDENATGDSRYIYAFARVNDQLLEQPSLQAVPAPLVEEKPAPAKKEDAQKEEENKPVEEVGEEGKKGPEGQEGEQSPPPPAAPPGPPPNFTPPRRLGVVPPPPLRLLKIRLKLKLRRVMPTHPPPVEIASSPRRKPTATLKSPGSKPKMPASNRNSKTRSPKLKNE